MTIRLLKSGDEAALEQFLAARRETSMFLRSNMRRAGLDYRGEAYDGEYFACFAGAGEITGVLAHYWNGNLMMQAPEEKTLRALTEYFRVQATRPVKGILGPDDQAGIVMDDLDLANHDYAIDRREALYTLDLDNLVAPQGLENAKMVAARKVAPAVLTDWFRAYEKEALGAEDGDELEARARERAARAATDTNLWALMVAGEPVSMSGFNAALDDIVQIGPVWTPPNYRNNNYARILLAETLSAAKARGVRDAILFTDHPAATRAYEAIGFERIGSYRLALLKAPAHCSARRQQQ